MEHVLVGYASRHGATRGIAERIGTRLRDAGLDVTDVSDYTGFMYMGELVEMGRTTTMFRKPSNPLTEEYITGRFG